MRCRRLLNEIKHCPEFEQFEEQLNKDTHILKDIEMDHKLDDDETLVIMNEVFDSVFDNKYTKNGNNNNMENSDQNEYDTLSLKFCDYLKLIAIKAKGFQYRLAIGDDNAINGVVWMNATMRSNLERFGSYICLDAMKRQLNTLN